MRNLINLTLMVVLLFATNAMAEKGKFGRSASLDGTGSIQVGSIEKFFVNCKNTSGGALEDGDLVVADVANDDGFSCTSSAAPGAVPLCVLNEACADDAMCECQTYGFKSNVNFDSTNDGASAGDQVFLSESTAGKVQSEALGSIAASDVMVGVFYDEITASGDAEIFLRLR